MRLNTRFALLALCAALPSAGAFAADYEPPVILEEAPEYVPVEVGSGWYLRGDIGYVVETDSGRFSYRTYDPFSDSYGRGGFDHADIENEFTVGGGIGYRITDYLRTDLTFDGFTGHFSGGTSSSAPCVAAFVGTSCRSDDGTDLSGVSILANAYVDLGTFAGFTPYAGAGVGYTYLSWKGLDSHIYCVDGAGACPAGYLDEVDRDRLDDWRLTYAVMAGVAYDITNNLKVDLGYKYRHVDGGEMFRWDDYSKEAGARGTQGDDDGFSQHEVQVGLRYELW